MAALFLPIWTVASCLLLPHFRTAVLGCSPPPPNPFSSQPRHFLGRLFGEQTQQGGGGNSAAPADISPGIDRASALSGPVRSPEELYCYDFDDKCRWRNMEGLLVDELDWHQGGADLDENRLRLATGTHLTPEGFYGIAATDKTEFAGVKAILVSDVIECQNGVANLRFMYWTSPEVKITVCVKSILRLFPYFDYCSKPIENGDPGPVFLTLPEINEPMQIFIQAHNFVFNSAALQGGFAIIDNLEYYGEFCERDTNGLTSTNGQFAAAKAAPPQSALRPGYQQLIPFPSAHPPAVEKPKPSDGGAGPYEGFRSLLDWMMFGNGLLGRQRKLEDLLNSSGGVQIETVAPPPPPPSQLLATEHSPTTSQFPVDVPKHELRSLRIVQRERNEQEEGEEENGAADEEGPTRPSMDIQKSLLVNGQMPAKLHIRRRQPHLELLARRKAMEEEERRREKVEEAEEERGKEEEEEEEGPSQVEREEWIHQ